MRKLYIFGLIALACVIVGLALADQMTFTTYYPAPYGVYKDMVVMNRLGVGTTSPSYRLQIDSGTPDGEDPIKALIGPGYNNATSYNPGYQRLGIFSWGGNSGISLGRHGVGGYLIENEGQVLTFKAGYDGKDKDGNDNEKMRIDNNGNVGIGTATPQAPAPNETEGEQLGNLDVNDIWIRSKNSWLSDYQTKIYYATDTQAGGRTFSDIPANPPHYHDPYLTLNVPVKKGDIVKVTIGGSIRGQVYTGIQETTDGAQQYLDKINSSSWTSATQVVSRAGSAGLQHSHWGLLYLVGVYQATKNTTLIFKQAFIGYDFGITSCEVAARSAVAEVHTP